MSMRQEGVGDDRPIERREDMLAVFTEGEKPRDAWRLGTEHEKFAYRKSDLRAPAYAEPGGIRDLLAAFARFGWEPVVEGGDVIGLRGTDGSISLEPAGQFELSGAQRRTVHETAAETRRHRDQCVEVGADLGLGFLGIGFHPTETRAERPWMPKGRYAIMRDYMPRVGSLGLDMMTRTCTIQVNLDYASEADMVMKFRVAQALQPVATALFANAPLKEGAPSGLLSLRSQVWTDTDPDRTGILPFVTEDGFGYERYLDWALDVPMYFVHRGDRYIDCSGQSFRGFLDGRLACLPGERPTLEDFKDHLSTLFPEVRMKSFLEMRGADGGPAAMVPALAAFWAGLLYCPIALDQAWQLVRHWPHDGVSAMRSAVPRLALRAPAPDGRPVREVALDVLELARQGLSERRSTLDLGESEACHLGPLWEIAEEGVTLAERLLDRFRAAPHKLFASAAF
ncbi:MAG: glutamate--cysteine ligase [Thermaurantiacus sp.]